MKKIFSLFLSLLLCAAASAETGARIFDRAKKETDINARIKLLTQAIAKDPKLVRAYQYRGDAYKDTDKIALAVNDYSSAVKLKPDDPFLRQSRALGYIAQKKYGLAVEDLDTAVKIKKNFAPFYLNRADALFSLENYSQAAKDYEKYASLNKKRKDSSFYLILGRSYAESGQTRKAQKNLNRYIALKPSAPDGYFYLGQMYYKQNDGDEAVSWLSKAINRDASYAPAYLLRAKAFKEMGDYGAAADDYTKLLALAPDYQTYNRRGRIYEAQEKYGEAYDDYSKAIELNPKWPIPYNNRGYASLYLKKYDDAKKDLDEAVKLDASLPTPYVNLAAYYWLVHKDKKQALRNLDMAMQRNFKDLDELHSDGKKAWMFAGLNTTPEFRVLMYK